MPAAAWFHALHFTWLEAFLLLFRGTSNLYGRQAATLPAHLCAGGDLLLGALKFPTLHYTLQGRHLASCAGCRGHCLKHWILLHSCPCLPILSPSLISQVLGWMQMVDRKTTSVYANCTPHNTVPPYGTATLPLPLFLTLTCLLPPAFTCLWILQASPPPLGDTGWAGSPAFTGPCPLEGRGACSPRCDPRFCHSPSAILPILHFCMFVLYVVVLMDLFYSFFCTLFSDHLLGLVWRRARVLLRMQGRRRWRQRGRTLGIARAGVAVRQTSAACSFQPHARFAHPTGYLPPPTAVSAR